MKQEKQDLVIPFSGLKDGGHHFIFDIDAKFFEQFEKSIIQEANVHIDIDFIKKPNMLLLEFSFSGTVYRDCDRCMDVVEIPLSGEGQLIVKFGDEDYTGTDDIRIIPHEEYKLDISKEVYDYVHLSLPNRITHLNEDDCNKEVIKKLKSLSVNYTDTEETDPRWSALLNLKDKN